MKVKQFDSHQKCSAVNVIITVSSTKKQFVKANWLVYAIYIDLRVPTRRTQSF